MTSTRTRKVKRETCSEWRGRPLVIELDQFHVSIRLKGTRATYRVAYEQIFKLGAENEAKRHREERAKAKKEKQGESQRLRRRN